MVKVGGYCCYVVGNRTVKGEFLRTDLFTMEQFEKLRERLNDALAKIDSAMETVSENKEDANLSSSLMSENLGLKSQVKALESELESLRKDNIAHIDIESLSTELAALRAEREEEKKELQTLYDQLSSALSEEGRAD